MKVLAGLACAAFALLGVVGPAMARDQYVIDNAHLFSATTVSSLNQKIADFNAQTGKEVVVDTEATTGGRAGLDAAERTFAQQQVNGVLIYVAKSPKTIAVVPDRAAHQFFPPGETASIRNAIKAGFNSGDFDGGITNGVDLTLGQYRSHVGSLRTHANQTVPAAGSHSANTGGFFSMSFIWLILILVVGFLIVRAIFRAMAGPRMYGPGPGGPGYGPGGPGYGPGYGGPGYGGGGFGGGGGFWSGMLGGLGGAFLGNELFGRHDVGGGEFGGGTAAGVGDTYTQQDASGWQSDAGQADASNASAGGWGDSGGFDSGGGGFDSGGGGDSGGW